MYAIIQDRGRQHTVRSGDEILCDLSPDKSAGDAITYAARAAVMSHETPVELTLLHVGSSPDWPSLPLPDLETCSWHRLHRQGNTVDQIVEASLASDLVVMATEGSSGIMDALRGSVTEQVLRRATCPVLAVPARS